MEDREFERLAKMVKDACKHCADPKTNCDGCPGVDRCQTKFHEDVHVVIKGYEERLAAQKATQPLGIKGLRDEALMNLYKHYNRLTALEDIDYTTLESMHILIDSIEKLEHARQMEASDEIAKMAIEKLEKLAAPIPEIQMSGIPKEVRAVMDKCEKKEGAENDD